MAQACDAECDGVWGGRSAWGLDEAGGPVGLRPSHGS